VNRSLRTTCAHFLMPGLVCIAFAQDVRAANGAPWPAAAIAVSIAGDGRSRSPLGSCSYRERGPSGGVSGWVLRAEKETR
jgi:hypothetical protein